MERKLCGAPWRLGLAICLLAAPSLTASAQPPLERPAEPGRIAGEANEQPRELGASPEDFPNPLRHREQVDVLGGDLLGITNIGDVSTSITTEPAEGSALGLPKDVAKDLIPDEQILVHSTLTFHDEDYRRFLAPGHFHHQPTYFEETKLERYGHTRHPLLQPWISGVKFGINTAALPYKMASERPRHCHCYQYPFESGGLAPHYFDPYPLSVRGAIVETAFIAGAILIFP